jgi:hypothetical protein
VRRRDVALSIAAGLLVVLYVALAPASVPVLTGIASLALEHWYAGIAVLVASILLRRSTRWPDLTRVLGMIGVTWVSFFVGYLVALVLVFAFLAPIGS